MTAVDNPLIVGCEPSPPSAPPSLYVFHLHPPFTPVGAHHHCILSRGHSLVDILCSDVLVSLVCVY